MTRPHRSHPLWYAYALHRISGLGLALFLPFHFYILSKALHAPEALDGFLRFAENPWVKGAEFGLVFGLAVHMFGGLRLIALEWLPWLNKQKTLAALAVASSFLIATLFLLKAI